MVKDINIHIKAHHRDAKRNLDEFSRKVQTTGDETTQSSEKMARGTSRASDFMKRSLGTLAGIAGFAGLAAAAVSMVRKIIQAVNDMKKAVTEAVQELAALQKTSADYFEAFDAYTPGQRKGVLRLARSVQATTGLDYESSKNILEAYKRTFGEVNKEAVEQLAGYHQLHGGAATTDLVRWLGASGVKDKDRQGQILRMISTTATQTGLKDPEIIQGLVQYSTEFRQMGWTPEQSITNVGKTMSGLSGREARRAISGLVDGLRSFSEEKAREMGAPEAIAVEEQARLDWATEQIRKAGLQERKKMAQDMFGQTYAAYVTKFMVGEMSLEASRDLMYAMTPEAAEEERQKVLAYRETAEGVLGRAEGKAGILGLEVSEEEKKEAAIRAYGKSYLEYLRRTDRLKYEKIKAMYPGEEMEYEGAAKELWLSTRTPEDYDTLSRTYRQGYPQPRRLKRDWGDVSYDERLEDLGEATEKITQITNIHYGDNYNTLEVGSGDARTPLAFE